MNKSEVDIFLATSKSLKRYLPVKALIGNSSSNTRWNKDYLLSFIDSHIIDYPTPVNLNYMWSFGSTAGICLVIQILTGVFLAMHYCPHIDLAFESVEHIMTDVNNGWLIRYMHANGASMFFIVVYCHIFRGLYYGSYIYPRGRLWATGVIIFLLMMATAFMGYVLPWGQMSFWGATVITNLFSAIPFVGGAIVEWLWGGFSVSNATLNRFFSLHYLMPFVIAAFTIIHLSLLHKDGSNNPLGINVHVDYVPFYPYFYVKDLLSFFLFVTLFAYFVFFNPNVLGHSDNYIPANPLSTPAHIVPEWYFLPFYAILRSIPDKLGGVIAMISAILVLLILPLINTSFVRSSKFRPLFATAYWFLAADFVLLGWIGQKPVEAPYIEIGMLATFFYFFFLLILIPAIGLIEFFFITHVYGEPNRELEASLRPDLRPDFDVYWGFKPLDWTDWYDGWLQNVLFQHVRLWYEPGSDPFEPDTFGKYTNIIVYF